MKNCQVNYGIRAAFVCGAIALGLLVGCADDPAPVKNRVPTVGAQIEEAQQAAKDARAAADSATQTQKDINAAIDKLNGRGVNSDGSWKVGQPQLSAPGTVTETGEIRNIDGQTTTFIFWFTFNERGGFVKKYMPVCPNQSIPVNNTVTLNFHWKEYQDANNVGCYMIDGYTVVK